MSVFWALSSFSVFSRIEHIAPTTYAYTDAPIIIHTQTYSFSATVTMLTSP